jgi:hypothetical protein
MRPGTYSVYSAAIIAALLGGCAASSSQNGAPGLIPSNGATAKSLVHRNAWMSPGAANEDLLYITDGNGEVTVYRYWQRTIVGELTNFTQPMGECVDKGGDIFIADYSAQQIVEYAHGGSKPIHIINDAPYNPYTCAVDLATGNLAVANAGGGLGNEGNIAVYPHASGTPRFYTDQKLFGFQGVAYDNDGILLATNGNVGSSGYSETSYFAWLPKSGKGLVDINLPGPDPSWQWRGVAGIQWDGSYWAIDGYYDGIVRDSLFNGQAYYVGTTSLEECCGAPGPYWIYNNTPSGQGTQIVGGVGSEGEVYYWDYPAGGDAIHSIYHGIDDPFAVAVSLKKKHG